jgi:hypothetical protein
LCGNLRKKSFLGSLEVISELCFFFFFFFSFFFWGGQRGIARVCHALPLYILWAATPNIALQPFQGWPPTVQAAVFLPLWIPHAILIDLSYSRPVAKNGCNVGDINHGNKFPLEFRKNCAEIILSDIRQQLDTPAECTGRRLPVAISVDKMTQKHRTGQITAGAFPDLKAPPNEIIKTIFIGNPVVREHDGKGLATSAVEELRKILNFDHVSTQVIGGGTDGQYFTLHFEDHLDAILQLKKSFYTWDPAHRSMLGEGDVKKALGTTGFVDTVFSTVSDLLKDVRFGKKYEALLEAAEQCPDAKFYQLGIPSQTR